MFIHIYLLIIYKSLFTNNSFQFYIKRLQIYTPKTDAIEQYFNQVKTYLKKDRNVENFQELEKKC
jgi:hypothetical protein